jgi:hypothetical protein
LGFASAATDKPTFQKNYEKSALQLLLETTKKENSYAVSEIGLIASSTGSIHNSRSGRVRDNSGKRPDDDRKQWNRDE